MAGIHVAVTTGDKVALAANTAKTVLTFKIAANYLALIESIELNPYGTTSSNAPIEWWLEYQTSDGSIAGTAANAVVVQGPGVTLSGYLTSALYNISSEATPSSVLWRPAVHPQGFWTKEFTPGREIQVGGTSAQRVALRAKAAADVSVTAAMLVHV